MFQKSFVINEAAEMTKYKLNKGEILSTDDSDTYPKTLNSTFIWEIGDIYRQSPDQT